MIDHFWRCQREHTLSPSAGWRCRREHPSAAAPWQTPPRMLLHLPAAVALLALASVPRRATGWDVHRLAFPADYPWDQPPVRQRQTSNATLPACVAACTEARGCQGFAACSAGPVGCWTYGNITGRRLNNSADCDWHAAPWAPPATPPPPLCNLHGNWSMNADYNAATNWSIHGNYTTHIEFFQPAGSHNFTLR